MGEINSWPLKFAKIYATIPGVLGGYGVYHCKLLLSILFNKLVRPTLVCYLTFRLRINRIGVSHECTGERQKLREFGRSHRISIFPLVIPSHSPNAVCILARRRALLAVTMVVVREKVGYTEGGLTGH